MSNLDLKEFHSFLEELIEDTSRDGRFSVDKVISTLLSRYPKRVAKIQDHLNNLGLRALIRNNCRAKKSTAGNGLDLFGNYRIGKRIPVPWYDERGKLRWDKKRREELSFDELDRVRARLRERPAEPSQECRDLDDIARRTKPYRKKARNVGEAIEMAQQDGR